MKTKEEIEQLANDYGKSVGNRDGTTAFDFKLGYTQCQEDMQKDVEYWQGEFEHWHQQAMEMADKKYTEEDIRKAFKYGVDMEAGIEPFDYKNYPDGFSQFINSLNKQD